MKLLIIASLLFSLEAIANEIDWEEGNITVSPSHIKTANTPNLIPDFIKSGEKLFSTKFNIIDGAGRPGATGDSKPTTRNILNNQMYIRTAGPDAMSCVACHNQPKPGGSGDFIANAFVGAHFSDPPTTSIGIDTTSDRNTTNIFGAGLIELVAKEITTELKKQQGEAFARAKLIKNNVTINLSSKGIKFGSITVSPTGYTNFENLVGIDYDLIVRPFGVKGIAASLREFTIAALNQHHGMQAEERFGWERTGRRDFDLDGVYKEISIGQLSALVLYQATLSAPKQMYSKLHPKKIKETRGKAIFSEIKCAKCHIPSLPLNDYVFSEPNQYNRPGALKPNDIKSSIILKLVSSGVSTVHAYTDLKRHVICDKNTPHFCNEKLKQDNVPTASFLTAKLWDINTSAPYGHRGDLSTITEAIIAHGGEASNSKEMFLALKSQEKESLVLFLQSLGASPYD